jgi:hypothetical protein
VACFNNILVQYFSVLTEENEPRFYLLNINIGTKICINGIVNLSVIVVRCSSC